MSRLREDEMVKDVTVAGDEGHGADERKGAGDGIDRRNFLGCMAWAGTGLLWTFAAGVPTLTIAGAGGKGRRRGDA